MCVCGCLREVSWCLASPCNYLSGQHKLIFTTFCSQKSRKKQSALSFDSSAPDCARVQPQKHHQCAAISLILCLFTSFWLFFHHHRRHLTIFFPLVSLFILVLPSPLSCGRECRGERRTGGNWCNEFRALMLAEASLPRLLVAINLPHSVRAKCAHNRQRGSSN